MMQEASAAVVDTVRIIQNQSLPAWQIGLLVALVPSIIAGLISWGIGKGKEINIVTWPQHRKVCKEKSDEVNQKLDKLFDLVLELHEKLGFVRGSQNRRESQ